MSTEERNQLWMAYLDGEMTAAEAAAFDATLSPEERTRLDKEKHMEQRLAEQLADGATCPPLLWKRVQQELAVAEPEARRVRPAPWRWLAPVALAAAATVVIAVAYTLYSSRPDLDPYRMQARTTAELAEQRDASAPANETAVAEFLMRHGVPVALGSIEAHNATHQHQVELLGARSTALENTEGVEVLYACCGFPARVVIVPAESKAGAALEAHVGAEGTDLLAVKRLDGFIAGVVSKHPAYGVLETLQPRPMQTAGTAEHWRDVPRRHATGHVFAAQT
jgi:hypothetical protein